MAVILVIHEIDDEERRTKVVALLKRRHRVAMKLTESAYAVHTTLMPARIFDQIKQHLRSDDRLYVIPLTRPYTGYGPRATTTWLSNYLYA